MLKALFSKPYSRVFIVGDNSGWVTDVVANDLKGLVKKLSIPVEIIKRMYLNLPQVVHYTSQFSLLLDIYKSKNRLSVDYYHGRPEQDESFRLCFEALRAHHQNISMVRVSNKEMEELIKSSGIAPEKVVRIPIGIDTNIFTPTTHEARLEARKRWGIPEGAFVIGSFQKDGVGWGEGNEPKLIKGPDIFLKVVEELKKSMPNLFVLLSGPARGYIKKGLEKLGIPYHHEYFKDYREISKLYDALDLYLITSREEGGPMAVLESMSKGIALVTTAVGQAKDLVKHGQNAMMAPIDAVEELAQFSREIIQGEALKKTLVQAGFLTARDNSLTAQLPLWRDYFKNLINS